MYTVCGSKIDHSFIYKREQFPFPILYLKLFQHVNVAPLDPFQHPVVQVEFVAANPMLLAPNVRLVSQAFMDFQTAKVKIKTF